MTSLQPSGCVDDHGSLADAAREMTGALAGLEGRLTAGPTGAVWWPDHEFAKRIAHLGEHCSEVLESAARGHYASAFTVLRTCLEQHLVDQLLFHARRYEQLIQDVDDLRFAEFEADLAAGTEPWTANVHGLRREKDRVFVVREGVEVKNGEGAVVGSLSPYYSFVQDHQPLLGKKADQQMLDGGVIELTQLRAHADRNEDLYRRFLSWGAIRRNLELNGLWSELDLRRLDVHYRFLGAFVHATHHGYDLLERWPAPDHFASELILLYVTTIASREIESFADYVDASGRSVFREVDDLRLRTSWAAGEAAHFWFPGSRPHGYDRWREANRRGFLVSRNLDPDLPAVPPDQIRDDDIGYYGDPLDRVRKMHQSQSEMITGYTYISPW